MTPTQLHHAQNSLTNTDREIITKHKYKADPPCETQ